MIKNIICLVCCLICCSCQWTEAPNNIIDESSRYLSYTEYDTINMELSIKKLPYIDSNLKIYSDSCYFNNSNIQIKNDKVTVFKNGNLFVEVNNYYKIETIKWINTDMKKTIELVHTPYQRTYWCGDDIYIDSVYISLIRLNRMVNI